MTKRNEPETRSCPYCKAPMTVELLNYKMERDGEELLLEEVPTWVCEQCEATIVDDEVIAAVEEMLDELDAGLADRDDLPQIDLSE